MDEATKAKLRELLGRRLVELTVGEALTLALSLDEADDAELAELVGLPVPDEG